MELSYSFKVGIELASKFQSSKEKERGFMVRSVIDSQWSTMKARSREVEDRLVSIKARRNKEEQLEEIDLEMAELGGRMLELTEWAASLNRILLAVISLRQTGIEN